MPSVATRCLLSYSMTRALPLVLSLVLSLAATAALAAPPAGPQLWTEKNYAEPLDPDSPVSISAFSRLARELSPAVVNIAVVKGAGEGRMVLPPMFGGPRGERMSRGLGTGFIIHEDGLALTNRHVIDGATRIEVMLAGGETYEATVVGSYQPLDVALIKFRADRKLTVAALGTSADVQIGEWVVAIGNALGLNHTVTAGIVSAIGRHEVQPGNSPMYANFIQTDASINPGNSGGPLINTRGEVIGINTAINAAGQGIGFAVPIDMVKKVLPELATGKVARSYLGVRIGPVDRALAARAGLDRPMGTLIREVVPKYPAANGGVEAGDIVTHFDGQPITHWEQLSWLASTAGADRRVAVKVRRGKTNKTLKLKLTEYPQGGPTVASSGAGSGSGEGLTIADIGIRVGPVTGRGRTKHFDEKRGGVVVLEVDRGSPATSAGVRPGDIILQVNYEDVSAGVQDFAERVRDVRDGDVLSFLIQRGQRRIFIAFSR